MAAGLSGLFGKGSVAEQLIVWQVLAQLLGAVLTPPLELVQREANKALQATPLTPAQLADMVVRNIADAAAATDYAKESGIAPADFLRMIQSAGEAPSPQELLAAFRRGLIPLEGTGPNVVSVQQGVAEGRTYNKYLKMLEGLADVPIGPADAVDAVVEGQITHEQGAAIAFLSGISPANFQILVNTRGNPPSPTELNELHKRGLIPLEGTGPDVTSVQQGIFEGATKDKWWKLLAALADYIPPPRTVTALVREGSITDDEALLLFREAGLTQDLAAAYLTSAHHQKTAAERDLTVATIKGLYQDGLIDAAQATQMLEVLRYTPEDVAFLLDLWNFENLQTRVRTAVSKIHNLYVAHKLTLTQASAALDGLGVPAAGRDQQLAIWTLERDANVPQLTRAEIVDAWFYGVIDLETSTALLEALGWTAGEADILRGIRAKGKQPAPAGP